MKVYPKFIIPSLFGVFIFLIPVVFEGKITIPMGVLVDIVKASTIRYLPAVIVGIIVFSAIVTVLVSLMKPQILDSETFFGKVLSIFDVSWPWIVLRNMGAVFACLVFFKTGPEWIWAEETGGVVLYEADEFTFKHLDVYATCTQDPCRRGIIGERQQEVFHGHEFVAFVTCLLKGAVERKLEFFA